MRDGTSTVEVSVVRQPKAGHMCGECKEWIGHQPHIKLVGVRGSGRRFVKRLHPDCVRADADPRVLWAVQELD